MNLLYIHTRCDQKIIVIFNFFKKYLFIYQSCPLQSNPPSDVTHLWQRFFQSLKHFWKALFGIANSFCFDFSFISSNIAKRFLSSSVLGRGKIALLFLKKFSIMICTLLHAFEPIVEALLPLWLIDFFERLTNYVGSSANKFFWQ